MPLLALAIASPSGVLYREMGNMERAMQCYPAALNARPNFPQASTMPLTYHIAGNELGVGVHGRSMLGCS